MDATKGQEVIPPCNVYTHNVAIIVVIIASVITVWRYFLRLITLKTSPLVFKHTAIVSLCRIKKNKFIFLTLRETVRQIDRRGV